MSSAEKPQFVDVKSYLESEAQSETKHEYVNGWLRAMAGASNRHNVIATNVQSLLWSQLKNKPCQAMNSDTRIKIQLSDSTFFYYPDASVICESNSPSESFQEAPVFIAEVLSISTRAVDFDEKLNNYLQIDSLQYCLLIEQIKPRAVLLRREESGFLRETYEKLDDQIQLPAIDCILSLRDIYDRIDFSPEAIREEIIEYAADAPLS